MAHGKCRWPLRVVGHPLIQVYNPTVFLRLSEGEVALSEGHPSFTQRSCVALSFWRQSEERTESEQISGETESISKICPLKLSQKLKAILKSVYVSLSQSLSLVLSLMSYHSVLGFKRQYK